MSVIVNIIGAMPESEEYQCAIRLKELLEKNLPKTAIGEITLHPNATLIGQAVKDIDLLMIGMLQNVKYPLLITDKDNNLSENSVEILDFCTAIEIKSHDVSGIVLEGTEFFVKYGGDLHSVTSQSNSQKISVMNYFKRAFNGGVSPYVTNVIWFTGATQSEINNMLKLGNNTMASNTLGNDFDIKNLFQTIAWQYNPKFYNRTYHVTSIPRDKSLSDFQRILRSFTKAKESMGELTRKKIEMISQKSIISTIDTSTEDKMIIYRGKAGTGKTIGLIQMAINYVDDRDARVIILTYNKALVSDMRRLFTLAELPDMFQDKCVSIDTMHSFFFQIINKGLYDNKLSGDDYINNYNEYIVELLDFLKSDSDAKKLLLTTLRRDYKLNWDYCFVDEAQDWSDIERDILTMLFSYSKIVVADGGLQFVRNIDSCDWLYIDERKTIKLKNCLRQKANIVRFINSYLAELQQTSHKITENPKMPGGSVIVSKGNINYKLLNNEIMRMKQYGNIAYDMIVFVPHTYVKKNPRCFKYTDEFEKNGIYIWDGTNDDQRSEYSIYGDEIRVLQYESSRGLEGWSVVCAEFDTFIEDKINNFSSQVKANSLLLQSEEDVKRKFILNWILLPLTRAINTLIITLKNPESEISKTILKIANEHGDYIEIV